MTAVSAFQPNHPTKRVKSCLGACPVPIQIEDSVLCSSKLVQSKKIRTELVHFDFGPILSQELYCYCIFHDIYNLSYGLGVL